MNTPENKSLWELLWDYDPNGLVVVDKKLKIQVVNPAFCRLFAVDAEAIINEPISHLLDDESEFQQAWENASMTSREHFYEQFGLYVRKVIFPIPDQNLVACIIVDLTHEQQQREELQRVKREAIGRINEVVDNQMKVAQEIAGLLGETTAETKISMLHLLRMVEQDVV